MSRDAVEAEQNVRRALDELTRDQETAARLRQQARELEEAARERAHTALAEYAAALIDDQEAAVNMPLVREIYWEHLAVQVKALVPLVGVRSAGQVHAVVGPRGRDARCMRCGTGLDQKSRTSDSGGYWGAAYYCRSCSEEALEEYRAQAPERAAAWEAQRARSVEEISDLVRAGKEPDEVFIRYQDGPAVSLRDARLILDSEGRQIEGVARDEGRP